MQGLNLRAARIWAIAALLAPVLLGPIGPAEARKVACKSSEVSIPDEREGGGDLCISKKERKRAEAICKENGSSNWMECTCQDGNTVGACGD